MTQEAPISSPDADVYLTAEGLSDQLKHRSARGGALMIVSYAIQMVVGVGGTAILARMLTPEEFGLPGTVGVFIAFIVTLREFLLQPAVQRDKLSHQQASGLFWINVAASLVVAIVVALLAPVLAAVFGRPQLFGITLVTAAGMFFSMVGMLHVGLLRRQLRFGAITIMEIGAVAAGVVVGVTAAYYKAGYWALVYQQLTVWLWLTGASWLMCRWRPAPIRESVFHSDEGVRSMISYGQSATASRMLNFMGRNMDVVFVGFFFGPASLALYQKANLWALTPYWQIFIPITPVAISTLSRLQDDTERYRLYARTLLIGMFGVALPGTALLAIEADHVIPLLMGRQWLDAIPLLPILCVAAWCTTLTAPMQWIYLAEGRTRTQLIWSLISTPLMVIGIASGIPWGYWGTAMGFAISVVVLTFPAIWFCLRESPITLRIFGESLWRAAAASVLAGIGLLAIRHVYHPDAVVFAKFTLFSGIYTLLYAAIWIMFPGGWATLREFLRHFRELRQGAGA